MNDSMETKCENRLFHELKSFIARSGKPRVSRDRGELGHGSGVSGGGGDGNLRGYNNRDKSDRDNPGQRKLPPGEEVILFLLCQSYTARTQELRDGGYS